MGSPPGAELKEKPRVPTAFLSPQGGSLVALGSDRVLLAKSKCRAARRYERPLGCPEGGASRRKPRTQGPGRAGRGKPSETTEEEASLPQGKRRVRVLAWDLAPGRWRWPQKSVVSLRRGCLKCILIAHICCGGDGAVTSNAWFAFSRSLGPTALPPAWSSQLPLGRMLGSQCPPSPSLLSYITTSPAVGKQLGSVGLCGSDLCPKDTLPSQHSSLSPQAAFPPGCRQLTGGCSGPPSRPRVSLPGPLPAVHRGGVWERPGPSLELSVPGASAAS